MADVLGTEAFTADVARVHFRSFALLDTSRFLSSDVVPKRKPRLGGLGLRQGQFCSSCCCVCCVERLCLVYSQLTLWLRGLNLFDYQCVPNAFLLASCSSS